MESKKTVFVTGATGNQGGAIARNLNDSGRWNVMALSRNPESEASKSLVKEGIKVVKGDLNYSESYADYLTGIYGIFSVQDYKNGVDKEILQGKKLIDIALEKKNKHFVYSSVSGADLGSGVPHFESKYQIEEHLKKSQIPYTIIRPTSFYENLLNPEVKKRILKGKLVMPLKKETSQEYISVNEIGIVGTEVFNNPNKYLAQTLTIASDKMTMVELTEKLSKVRGQKMKYEKLPKIISRLVMGKDLYKMFNWINRTQPVFVKDIDAIRNEFSGLSNMDSWLKDQFQTKS